MANFSLYTRLFLLFSGLFFGFTSFVFAKDKPLTMVAVNYPLKFFAESIVGEKETVILPMPKDIDPAFWVPKTEDILGLHKIDIILLNGANYAKWLPKVSLPLSKLVNTSSEFRDAYIALEADVKHNHGAGGEHSHTGTAFTTWLDFSLAEQQAKAILNTLSKKAPSKGLVFEENYNVLRDVLVNQDKELTKIGRSLNGEALLGSHPVYQYLQKRYQLNLKSVHWEPEEAPTKEQWEKLQQILKSHPAKWMLWEGKPSSATVKKLESLGIKSMVFNPCANEPEKGDFVTVMTENIKNLRGIIKNK